MRTHDSRYLFAAAALLGATACGNPTVNGTYPGEPAIRAIGSMSGSLVTSPTALSVGLTWVNFDNHLVGPFTQDTVAPVKVTALPTKFELDVFDPPADHFVDQIKDASGAIEAELSFGFLYAFDDVDRNGKFQWTFDPNATPANKLAEPDVLLGLADTLIVYVKTPPTPEFAQDQLNDDLFTSIDPLTAPGFYLARPKCDEAGRMVGKNGYQIVDRASEIGITLIPPPVDIKHPPAVAPNCLLVL